MGVLDVGAQRAQVAAVGLTEAKGPMYLYELALEWEEVLRRDLRIEVVDKPVYAYSNFLHAIRSLPVRIAA